MTEQKKRKYRSVANMELMKLSNLIGDDARDFIAMGFTDADFLAVVNGEVTLDEMASRVFLRERERKN